MRKRFKKILAISMAFSMIFSTNAFATPIDLANSEMDVKTDTLDKSTGTDYFTDENNEWLDGTINEEVRVTVDLASQFEITIPKEIVLNGEDGTAQYKVKAVGDIAGDQKLSVVPDPDFVLSEAGGKDDVTAIVTQPNTEYVYTDLQGNGTEYDGSIAATLTAGEWSGRFVFNIKFEGGETDSGDDNETELPEVKATLNDYTWEEISAISKSGEAQTTYGLKVGDTKEMTLSNGETYNAQIIGFNHDDLADSSGKAGITFGLKEMMTTKHNMNSASDEYPYGHNIGGWKASEMYSYLNNEEDSSSIFNQLPQELRNVIKFVNKKTSAGNKSTEIITSKDRLFLFSEVEIFGTTNFSVSGEGEQYQYCVQGNGQKKYFKSGGMDFWWLRSPAEKSDSSFCAQFSFVNSYSAINSYYIVFGFCV